MSTIKPFAIKTHAPRMPSILKLFQRIAKAHPMIIAVSPPDQHTRPERTTRY